MIFSCSIFKVLMSRMKRFYIVGLLLVCMAVVVSAQQKELFILQTSDTHSRIEPIPRIQPIRLPVWVE